MEDFNFDWIVRNVKEGINFSYARFGDGEWNCILGRSGKNCDKHHYFPDMGTSLRTIIESKPKYYIGIQPFAIRQNRGLSRFQRMYTMNSWVDNEIFPQASEANRMSEFVEAFKGKRHVIQVGNESLKKLNLADVFIEIPLYDCWLDKDRILADIIKVAGINDLILYSSGMPTKYFIDELYKKFGNSITQIDCGSVWDYYAGRISRSYMRRLKYTL
jgi:hypothetical protein